MATPLSERHWWPGMHAAWRRCKFRREFGDVLDVLLVDGVVGIMDMVSVTDDANVDSCRFSQY
jgi:hypothetical protein